MRSLLGVYLENAMRSRPGSRPTSAAKVVAGGGAKYGAPESGPEVTSRNAALSRTLRVMTCSVLIPAQPSPRSGPCGLRPRVGFRPSKPQHEAGIRIEPPPSEACADGTIPAATAASPPPPAPPAPNSGFPGLWVAPKSFGSVVMVSRNSGVLVLRKITAPASL